MAILAGNKKDNKNYDVEVKCNDQYFCLNVWAYSKPAAVACCKRLGYEVRSVNRVG